MPPATAIARRIAQSIPFVHFPARTRLALWSPWREFSPPSRRSPSPPSDWFERLDWEHVFFYAGPCCYALRGDAVGDSAAYFGSDLPSTLSGRVAPFDTGACRPSGNLQPYASRGAAACRRVIQRSSVPTQQFSARFEEWLGDCYDTPARYLETTTDSEYTDGEPDRTRPRTIGPANGSKGPRPCADRRAWTWELRTPESVSFGRIALLHVSEASLQDALALDVPFRVIARSRFAGARSLYTESEGLLRELIG